MEHDAELIRHYVIGSRQRLNCELLWNDDYIEYRRVQIENFMGSGIWMIILALRIRSVYAGGYRVVC